MGSVVERIRTELEDEIRSDFAMQLLQLGGFTLEKIAEMTRLGVDEVRALAEKNVPEALNAAK